MGNKTKSYYSFRLHVDPAPHQIIWAICQLIQHKEKLTKKKVREYLKDQISLFGSEDCSLIGKWEPSDDEIGKAQRWFLKSLKNNKD